MNAALPFRWNELAALIEYDGERGSFTWLNRSPDRFRDGAKSAAHQAAVWNAKHAGKQAGRVNPTTGYAEISISGRRYGAHRLAVMLKTGAWPAAMVDHINRDRTDNRWANLRCVTAAENLRNISEHRDCSTSHVVVSWDSSRRRWKDEITVEGRKRHLGRFKAESEAAAAYAEAKAHHHPMPVGARQ